MGGASSRQEAPLDLPEQEIVPAGQGSLRLGGDLAGRGVVPPSQHETTEQLKVQLVWDKSSFCLERLGASKHLWQLSASFTAEVPCELAAHFYCREKAGAHFLEYSPADGAAPPPYSLSFPAGRHTVRLGGDRAIDLKRWPLEVFWRYKKKQPDVLPIALSLCAPHFQSVVHLSLEVPAARWPAPTAGNGSELTCTLLKQKVFVGGREYLVKEVYGLADLGKDATHDESAVGEPCVICLSDPRNTAVLPCRHLCVCEDCARQLQVGAATRNDHCPICRGSITGMQVFDVKR